MQKRLNKLLFFTILCTIADQRVYADVIALDRSYSISPYQYDENSSKNESFECTIVIPESNRGNAAANVWDAYGLGVVPYDLSALIPANFSQ